MPACEVQIQPHETAITPRAEELLIVSQYFDTRVAWREIPPFTFQFTFRQHSPQFCYRHHDHPSIQICNQLPKPGSSGSNSPISFAVYSEWTESNVRVIRQPGNREQP